MIDKKEFYEMLISLDGEPLTEYARLSGDIDFTRYVVKILPGKNNMDRTWTPMTIRVPQVIAGFPPELLSSPIRHTALEDYLTRQLARIITQRASFDGQGVALQHLAVAAPERKILPRTSISINDEYIEARMKVRLPRRGGSIPSDELEAIFFDELPNVVTEALLHCNLVEEEVVEFLDAMEDAVTIRQSLPAMGLIGFVGQHSALSDADESGTLLSRAECVVVDDVLLTQFDTPHRGLIQGLGVQEGITLILGNVYSGRTEFMRMLADGIYNHIPGEGRDTVVTAPDAVYICAEPGRSVQKVNLAAFVSGVPQEQARAFSTDCASAFESQAAATAEALEIGARVLMYDEADSSGGFLSGDQRINALLAEGEVGTVPLAERARQIVDELGVSIIVAGAGGVSDFIPIADRILKIEDGCISDVTREVQAMGFEESLRVKPSADVKAMGESRRWVIPAGIDPSFGIDDFYISAEDLSTLEFGRYVIDLSAVRQLADIYQTETIGQILYYLKLRYMDESHPVMKIFDFIDEDLNNEGLECLSRELNGELARPRRYEIAAALNRLRSLRIAIRSDG